MFLTIPKHITIKRLIANGNLVDVYTEDDPDAPQEAEAAEFQFVRDFIRRTILADKTFGETQEAIYAGQEIRGALAGKSPGDEVSLSSDQHSRIVRAMKQPTNGYHPQIMACLTPFLRAVDRATEESSSKSKGEATAPAPALKKHR